MEDEVLESAISQMTIDSETTSLGHPDGVINHTAIVSSEAPEESLMYSPASELNGAVALLMSGDWEIIHEEQHASGA